MKYELTTEFPHEIMFEKDGPCISIYQPTHRHRPESKKDLIVFRQLVDDVESSLLKKYSKQESEELVKPLRDLQEDRIFWNNTKDGLAILLNKNQFIIYNISRSVKKLAVVSDNFHLKPLMRVFQSTDSYYVLGLNRQRFRLYWGNRYGLEEIEFDEDTPVTLEDVLGEETSESHLNQRSVGGANAMFHGHGGKKDEIDKDIERYFQYVDRFVLNEFSNPTQDPLILATLNEYQGSFRKLSHNQLLMDEGINKDFETMDLEELRAESWKIVEELYLDRTKTLVDRYNLAKSKDLGSDDLEEVIKKALDYRVETVLIESDRVRPGKIDMKTGEIKTSDLDNPDTDDLLDDLAEIILNSDAEVVLLPEERMPTDTGLAATFRY